MTKILIKCYHYDPRRHECEMCWKDAETWRRYKSRRRVRKLLKHLRVGVKTGKFDLRNLVAARRNRIRQPMPRGWYASQLRKSKQLLKLLKDAFVRSDPVSLFQVPYLRGRTKSAMDALRSTGAVGELAEPPGPHTPVSGGVSYSIAGSTPAGNQPKGLTGGNSHG